MSVDELGRCQTRLIRVNADRNQWRERAISAEQALGLYGRDVRLVALQTCLHLLGEEGYFGDPDYPEVDEALALYERLVGADALTQATLSPPQSAPNRNPGRGRAVRGDES